MKTRLKLSQGLSLIELSISLLLIACVLVLLMQWYAYNRQRHTLLMDQLSYLYDVNMTNTMILHAVRQAGYTPCAALSSLSIHDRELHAIEIVTQSGHSILRTMRMEKPIRMIQLPSMQMIHIKGRCPYHAAALLIIADCFHAELKTLLLQQSVANGCELVFNQALHWHYQAPAFIGIAMQESFDLHKNGKQQFLYYDVNHHSESLLGSIIQFSVHWLKHMPLPIIQYQWTDIFHKSYVSSAKVRAI